jgi:hypothetical protein
MGLHNLIGFWEFHAEEKRRNKKRSAAEALASRCYTTSPHLL